MKKLLFISLSISLFLVAVVTRRPKPAKPPKETLVSLLDEEKLFSKLGEPLPQWMEEQLEEDFAPFQNVTKEAVDATFAKICETYPHPALIHYRVVDGELYRYFPAGEAISLRDNSTERALKTILHYGKFDTLDFLFSYIDGIPLPDMPDRFYCLDEKGLQAPILSPAKKGEAPYLVLIPDWRSVCKWWAGDIENAIAASKNNPWEQKKEMAFWRGSFTKALRLQLCDLARKHPEEIDAKFHLPTENPQLNEEFSRKGYFGEGVPLETFIQYRFLPTLDGICCAYPSFQWRLLSNSLTLKEDSDEIQWFYRGVKPWTHFVPLASDLSDFFEKIRWAKSHEEECQKMISASTQFVLNHLMMEDVYRYLLIVFERYSALQKIDPEELKSSIEADFRWVNIQNRRKLRRGVEKSGLMERYTLFPTPF